MRYLSQPRGSNTLVRDGGVFRNVSNAHLNPNNQVRTAATSAGSVSTSSADPTVVRQTPRLYSPLYQESNLMLPKDRVTVNAWCLHFTETDHWVGNALELHSSYPLGGFRIVCEHTVVREFFENMADEMDLFDLVMGVGKDWWIFGEAFPFLEWDTDRGMWKHGVVYNPDYVEISTLPIIKDPIIYLKPDEDLRRIVRSYNQKDQLLRQQLPQVVIDCVMRGENIPLSPRNITHIARKTTSHHTRGTSILVRIFKELMLRDKLREAQFAIADNHVTPIKVFKIGSVAAQYIPDTTDLDKWRNLLEEATYDQNFSIVAHDAFDVQYIGSTGAVLNIQPDMDMIENNVLTGLFLSKAFTHSEGPTYSNAVVAYDILQKRYISFRNVIEKWLRLKVFKPVSEAQGFYEHVKGEKKLVIPEIQWDRLNLQQDREYQRLLMELNKGDPKTGEGQKVSDATLLNAMQLDIGEERKLIQEEKEEQVEVPQPEGAAKGKGAGPSPGGGGGGAGAPAGGGSPPVEIVPEALEPGAGEGAGGTTPGASEGGGAPPGSAGPTGQ